MRLAPISAPITPFMLSSASIAGARSKSIETLDEIAVTTQRREQYLQEVPAAVAAMSAGRLAEPGIDSYLGVAIQRQASHFVVPVSTCPMEPLDRYLPSQIADVNETESTQHEFRCRT